MNKFHAYHGLAVSVILIMVWAGSNWLDYPTLATGAANLALLIGYVASVVYIGQTTETKVIHAKGGRRLWQHVMLQPFLYGGSAVLCVSLIWSGFDETALHTTLRSYIIYPMMSINLMFWLAKRTTTLPENWLNANTTLATIYIAMCGGFITLSLWLPLTSLLALVINPLLIVIIGAMIYKTLSERNHWQTLSGHWVALAMLLYFVALGIPGMLMVQSSLNFETLNRLLLIAAPLMVLPGIANQVAAELRNINQRVTGLLPFWCVAWGIFGAALASYSENLLRGYGVTDKLPFSGLKTIAFGFVTLGMGFYVLAFFIRRVRQDG